METITETKSPANRPAGVPIRRYVGTFSDFRRLVRESILEIEKNSPQNPLDGTDGGTKS
jgi:hypothetical protein